MTNTYSLDTNIFVESWWKHYRPTSFASYWERMAEGITAGQVRASDEVRTELIRRADEVLKWTKQQPDLFVPTDEDIQEALRAALRECARMVGSHRGHNGADPWVIALASARSMTVVTLEHWTGNAAKPRVPDVCETLGIRWIDLWDFIEEMGWKF